MTRMGQKAQTSFEFLVLLSFMLLIFGGFFVVAEDLLVENNKRSIEQALITTLNSVRDEIIVANQVPVGYSRNFTLPLTVLEQEYDISVFENELLITTEDDIVFEYILFLPMNVSDATGSFTLMNLTKGPLGNQINHTVSAPLIRITPFS